MVHLLIAIGFVLFIYAITIMISDFIISGVNLKKKFKVLQKSSIKEVPLGYVSHDYEYYYSFDNMIIIPGNKGLMLGDLTVSPYHIYWKRKFKNEFNRKIKELKLHEQHNLRREK